MDEIAADWLLVGGRVHTLDPRRPRATALAVRGDRIAAVGDDRDLRRRRGRRTRVVDLRGATVIPGLVDTHAHGRRAAIHSPLRAAGRQVAEEGLEEDPLAVPLEGVARLACRLTMVGGRIVHGNG